MKNLPNKKKRSEFRPVKYHPHGIFTELHNQMDNLFNRFFDELKTPEWFPTIGHKGAFTPKFEISETDKAMKVKAELPGMDGNDISIDVCENVIKIKGEKKEEKETEEHATHISECQYGMFERTFSLPDAIDQEKIKASFKNGILLITMPKIKTAKPKTKKIDISS